MDGYDEWGTDGSDGRKYRRVGRVGTRTDLTGGSADWSDDGNADGSGFPGRLESEQLTEL